MISQWSERRQRPLQPQWERLWTHTILFLRYSLSVWGCACACVCVCVCACIRHTSFPIVRQSLKRPLCSSFLCFTHAPLDTGPWEMEAKRGEVVTGQDWKDCVAMCVCVFLFWKCLLSPVLCLYWGSQKKSETLSAWGVTGGDLCEIYSINTSGVSNREWSNNHTSFTVNKPTVSQMYCNAKLGPKLCLVNIHQTPWHTCAHTDFSCARTTRDYSDISLEFTFGFPSK